MYFSLNDAANETGKSKMTIQRAIKKGTLSAGRSRTGAYEIDPAELFRVFAKPQKTTPTHAPDHPSRHTPDMALLQSEIETLRARIDREDQERRRERDQLETTISDLRKRLDTESHERQRLTLLVTDERKKTKTHRRFWQIVN